MNAEWFYSVGDTRQGPVPEPELQRLATEGQLKPTDLVWRDGMADWVEAKTLSTFFPKVQKTRDPEEAREDDRPRRRGRRDEEYEDDRPSRREVRRRDEPDDDDDDRPRVSRRQDRYRDEYEDDRPRRKNTYRDEYDDAPRRKRSQRPGQVQAVGIMMLIGGIMAALYFLSTIWFLFCWPGVYFELVIAILAIIRGANTLGEDNQGPAKGIAICMIICIVNADVVNCVLGIVCLVMLSDDQVRAYYRRKGFDA